MAPEADYGSMRIGSCPCYDLLHQQAPKSFSSVHWIDPKAPDTIFVIIFLNTEYKSGNAFRMINDEHFGPLRRRHFAGEIFPVHVVASAGFIHSLPVRLRIATKRSQTKSL